MKFKLFIFICLVLLAAIVSANGQKKSAQLIGTSTVLSKNGFVNAADFGFSPEISGIENTKAMQRAVDQKGTIVISRPGTYKIAGTIYIGSNTSLQFGNNVFLKKVNEKGAFTHVFLNKGALTKTYDQHITIEGLNLIVNGVDKPMDEVFGLRGHLAFFYVKDLLIERFRCEDLAKPQYCIQVCTFEDIIINDVMIKGDKDGIHLGRGKRFTISNGVFQTYDDAVALNGLDYATGNPELGWIENGKVENCYDLDDGKRPVVGFFSRMLGGGWIAWKAGMEVRNSDAVVSNGRIYRVQAKPDGTIFHSVTQPTHTSGSQVLDGIRWGVVQNDVVYTAGVRNVVFRDIFLEKPRKAFSINFNDDNYCRSYYPGAELPIQEQIAFDNIRVKYPQKVDLILVSSPVDVITLANSMLRNNRIVFSGVDAIPDYKKTKVNMTGTSFTHPGIMELVANEVKDKEILLKTSSSIELYDNFSAKVIPGKGKITVDSDLKMEDLSTKPPLRQRLIFNSDGTDPLGNFMFHQRPLKLSDVNAYVDAYANTQVTTFMMCSGSDFPYYRSKYGRIFCDDLKGTLDCGSDTANCRYYKSYYQNHLNLEKEGTDIIDASLRRAKKDGMEAFISYRMNDLHFNDTTLHCPIVYTDFWMAHPDYWLNENTGWHSAGALNFAYQEVREQKLNMITEQLEKYGDLLDGYDLDFMRFPVFFKSQEGIQNAHLMTDLVKEVRKKVDELSARRGKKVLLSARVSVDLNYCSKIGLDVKEWVRQGLLDFVTCSIFFTGNPAMPVAKFREELGNPDIPVYAATENGGYKSREPYSNGAFRGMASYLLAQGMDGIYLFNYFLSEDTFKPDRKLNLEEGGQACRVILPDLLHEMGSLETLRKRNKIYSLDDGGSDAFGYKSDTPLPLSMTPENSNSASVFVGDDLKKDRPEEAILFLRLDKTAKFDLFVNKVKIKVQKPEYVGLLNRGNNLKKEDQVYAYILPASCLKQGNNDIRLKSSQSEIFKVKRLEIALKYGDVKTHGYF